MNLTNLLAGLGGIAALVGLLVMIYAAGNVIEWLRFWSRTRRDRREGRRQWAAAGWNTCPEDIKDGQQVIVQFDGWGVETAIRRGTRLISKSGGYSAPLDNCLGWIEFPKAS